jgi:hypothetical protein
MKNIRTGMRAVFLVASELAKRNMIVSPTSRSAFGADILITDSRCKKAFSIQVKSNAKPANFWLLSKNSIELKSDTHIYVFVNFNDKKNITEFFVVPSLIVANNIKVEKSENATWYSFWKKDALEFQNRWELIVS